MDSRDWGSKGTVKWQVHKNECALSSENRSLLILHQVSCNGNGLSPSVQILLQNYQCVKTPRKLNDDRFSSQKHPNRICENSTEAEFTAQSLVVIIHYHSVTLTWSISKKWTNESFHLCDAFTVTRNWQHWPENGNIREMKMDFYWIQIYLHGINNNVAMGDSIMTCMLRVTCSAVVASKQVIYCLVQADSCWLTWSHQTADCRLSY